MPRSRPRSPIASFCLVFFVSQLFWMPSAHATLLQLTRLYLVSRLPDEPVATPANRTSSPNAPITLYLVLEGRAPGRPPTYFTEAPAIDLGWGVIPANQVRPWNDRLDGAIEIQWSQIEPEKQTYDNMTPQFHFEEIAYKEVRLDRLDGKWSWPAAIHPTLMRDPAPGLTTGLGIGRFKVRVEQQKVELESPGAAGRYAGGIGDDVPWVAYRGLDADPLASWVQSRFNMPYVNGSSRRGKGQETHQAMLGVGSDNIDLIIAGWRLAGHDEVEFVGPFLLEPTHPFHATEQVVRGKPEANGAYVTPTGEPIVVGPQGILPGDLIRSSKQAGVYARDLPPMGVLSEDDIVVSALFREPRLEPLRDSLSGPVTVLRWNEIRQLELDLKQLGYYKGPVDGVQSAALWTAIAAIRRDGALEAIEREALEAMLGLRAGTWQAVPAALRLEAFRRRQEDLELEPAERIRLLQRLLAGATEAAGAAGEAAMKVLPPRDGLTPALWARPADQPFVPTEARFAGLEESVDQIAQIFVVADADRDGKVDATHAPAPVLAAGPGVVVGIERGWQTKKPSDGSRVLGNQVWLYLPRPDLLIGYLGMGDVAVKLGQVVTSGETLGTIGRTGRDGSRRRTPTQLRVVAFAGEQGRLSPVDPARQWGRELEAHPLPSRPQPVAHPAEEDVSHDAGEPVSAAPAASSAGGSAGGEGVSAGAAAGTAGPAGGTAAGTAGSSAGTAGIAAGARAGERLDAGEGGRAAADPDLEASGRTLEAGADPPASSGASTSTDNAAAGAAAATASPTVGGAKVDQSSADDAATSGPDAPARFDKRDIPD